MDDVTLRNGEFPRRLAGGRRLALLCFRLLPQRCDERLILVNQSIFKLTENLKSYLVARFLLRVLHAIRVHVVGALLSGTTRQKTPMIAGLFSLLLLSFLGLFPL